MTDLPKQVDIHEEGPREGFQIEPGPISTADKIEADRGARRNRARTISRPASFVSPRIVPGWADAEDVVAGFTPKAGVHYTALWFNASGLNRALVFRNKLTITGAISLTASEGFTQKNLHRSHAENVEAMRKQTALHLENGVDGAAHRGDGGVRLQLPGRHRAGAGHLDPGGRARIAAEAGADIKYFSLADTMGWATPMRIERVLGEVRSRWPDMPISLAPARYPRACRRQRACRAEDGRDAIRFDGRRARRLPVRRQPKAAGNICTEELVLLCEEMGIDTGVDLDALIEVGRMAEEIVGHQLPGELIHAGSLDAFRRGAAA